MKSSIIKIIILLAIKEKTCIAKYTFNPKIERVSYYNCGHCPCEDYNWPGKEPGGCSGTMGCCLPIHIYHYPKNIDKMIKQNPEFEEQIGKDFDFTITIIPQECRNSIKGSITAVKEGFKEQLKLLKECNAKDPNYEFCTNAIIEYYIRATEEQIKELEQKSLLPDDILIQDEFCKKEPLNPNETAPETCYQLWKYDSCGYCSTVEIKSYYDMQIECDKIVKKILKKTGKLY
jgi:hypothetical protein